MDVDATNASTQSKASTSYHSWGFTYTLINFLIFYITLPLPNLTLVSCFGWKFTYCLQEEIENRTENGNDDVEDNWEDPKIVPECLASQLKTCLFKNYRGKKCELQFAEYVMHSSKVLSNMTIHNACSIDLNAKYQMLQKLSLCPRGCKLIFQWLGRLGYIYIYIYSFFLVSSTSLWCLKDNNSALFCPLCYIHFQLCIGFHAIKIHSSSSQLFLSFYYQLFFIFVISVSSSFF